MVITRCPIPLYSLGGCVDSALEALRALEGVADARARRMVGIKVASMWQEIKALNECETLPLTIMNGALNIAEAAKDYTFTGPDAERQVGWMKGELITLDRDIRYHYSRRRKPKQSVSRLKVSREALYG